MKSFAAVVLLLTWVAAAAAQPAPAGGVSTRSLSGQFTVSSGSLVSPLVSDPELITNAAFVQLEPAVVAVSSERLKQALWRELGITGPWRGKIYLALHPARSTNEPVTVVSQHFADGWAYRLELPDTLGRVRFVRALTQAMLLEYANRGAGERSIEIPPWLIEGLTQQLLDSPEGEVLLPPRRWTIRGVVLRPAMVTLRATDPAETARLRARASPPLTFDALSWPGDEQFSGAEGDAYRRSAQLFVTELIALKDGRACLRDLLGGLPRSYNWQTAFLQAFHLQFERMLDVEKWWALTVAQLTGRDPATRWTPGESWGKLDEIVSTPVQVRATAEDLPRRTDVPLPDVISQWEPALQTQVLQAKSRELLAARTRATPELAALADDYRRLIDNYLRKLGKLGDLGSPGKPSADLRRLEGETMKSLAALEARRQALRGEANLGTTAEAGQPPEK